jgi:hypothetical protein
LPAYDSIVGDVERAVEEALRTRHDTVRSPSGRIAIDPSHLKLRGDAIRCLTCGKPKLHARHDDGVGGHKFASAYSAPARRVECASGTDEPIPTTVPNREVAPIIRGRSTRAVVIPMTGDAQMRRQTIGFWLRNIGTEHQSYLCDAATLRMERRHQRGRLRHVVSKLGSSSQRSRLGAEQCARMEAERDWLYGRIAALTKEHREIVRSSAYHEAVMKFYLATTRKYDTRECVFGSSAVA